MKTDPVTVSRIEQMQQCHVWSRCNCVADGADATVSRMEQMQQCHGWSRCNSVTYGADATVSRMEQMQQCGSGFCSHAFYILPRNTGIYTIAFAPMEIGDRLSYAEIQIISGTVQLVHNSVSGWMSCYYTVCKHCL